jgi:hypothetical protein
MNSNSGSTNDKKNNESSKSEKKEGQKDDSDDGDDGGDDDDDGGEEKKEFTPIDLDGGVDDATIQAVFEAVEEGLNEAKIDIEELKAYKDYPLVYSYKEGYATYLERGYVIRAKIPESSYKNPDDKSREKIHEVFDAVLTEAGFKKWNNLEKVEAMGGDYVSYKNKDNYYCTYLEQEDELGCGNTSWLSQEQKDFITELTDAYHVANKESFESYGFTMIVTGNKNDIKDSEVKPYQVLEGGTLDAWIWYYRKSPNDKWIFVMAGNGSPSCSDTFYATEELKNAFKGIQNLPCNQ